MPETKRPADLTHQDASELVEAATPKSYRENKAFYDGDHWQKGDGWIGPRLTSGVPGSATVDAELERTFTSRNAVKEVTNRHRDAAGGKETRWYLAPLEEREELDTIEEEAERKALQSQYDDEDAKIAELEADLTSWWDRRKAPKVIAQALANLLLGERATLRLFVPAGKLEERRDPNNPQAAPTFVIPRGSFADTLDRIYLDAPDPGSGMVYEDPDSREEAAIFIEEADNAEGTVIHLAFNDGEQTVFRQLKKGDTAEEAEASDIRINMGGRLPMFQMDRESFITVQVRQQQRALNLAMSTIPRNVTTSGFLERIFLNVQLPGKVERDPETGDERFMPEPFHTGPDTVNVLHGVEHRDAEGKSTIANPEVVFRDPVDPGPNEKAARAHYMAILEETDQQHVLIAGDAVATGISRVQARAIFEASLRPTVKEVEAAVRWLLETLVAMAEAFSTGKPPVSLEELRAVAMPVIDLGPIDAETRTAILDEVEKKARSRENAMELIGIEDVDAEIARIERQTDTAVGHLAKVQEVVVEYHREGSTWTIAAKLAGVNDPALLKLYSALDELATTPARQADAQDDEIARVLAGTAAEGDEEEEEEGAGAVVEEGAAPAVPAGT